MRRAVRDVYVVCVLHASAAVLHRLLLDGLEQCTPVMKITCWGVLCMLARCFILTDGAKERAYDLELPHIISYGRHGMYASGIFVGQTPCTSNSIYLPEHIHFVTMYIST